MPVSAKNDAPDSATSATGESRAALPEQTGSDAAELSGPKTQTPSRAADARSSVDVEEQARICLQHSPYRAIRLVDCRFVDGVLTLTGRVPTYHYKQLAQTAVSQLEGVRQIVNAIDVK